jgi:glucokinase
MAKKKKANKTGNSHIAIGVDLGGTSLMAAVVAPDGTILGECKRKTKAELGAVAVTERIAQAITKALKQAGLAEEDVVGVGVGVPGPLDPETGIVSRCPNLGASWSGFPLAQTLEKLLQMPVTIDNDVRVGAVGEHTFGAGRNTQDMIAIFVGTGLGGGIILDGKLRRGFRHSAGEVGHMVLLADGPVCSCLERGHAEALASRTAIEREVLEMVSNGQDSVVTALMHEEGRSAMSAGILGRAMEANDPVVTQAVEHAQYYLGLLISACVNCLDPEAIVVGGGVLERFGDAYLEPVRQVAQQHYINQVDAERVRIVRAELGDHSGALGAAILAQRGLGGRSRTKTV